MQKQEFMVFWDGENWISLERDSIGEYAEIVDFSEFDKLADGSRWNLFYKASNQRKWRGGSCITLSIYAMLDLVKSKLNAGEEVFCQTPDIVVRFEKI